MKKKWLKVFAKKIGILDPHSEDRDLIEMLLSKMQQFGSDYTLTFRYLSHLINNNDFAHENPPINLEKLKHWIGNWRHRLLQQNLSTQQISELMLSVNPIFISRNHKIEEIIKLAVNKNDFSKMTDMIKALSNPYKEQKFLVEYMIAPKPEERVTQTFCGT